MRYLKRIDEELNIELPVIRFKRKFIEYKDHYNDTKYKVQYVFELYNRTFEVLFFKEEEFEEFEYWERQFDVTNNERFLSKLNISNISALKIFGCVNTITQDFINEYKPDILDIHHISESRCRINSLFTNKMNIDNSYKITKKVYPTNFNKEPHTIIFKKNFNSFIEEKFKGYDVY